jgi:hypothetical protein
MTRRLLLISGIALVLAAPVLWAQMQSQTPDPASLAALTAEVRQVRLAIEESTRAQTQTQATAVYLTVQKDRIFQLTTRLDGIRKDLDNATREASSMASELASNEKALADGSAPPQIRQQLTDSIPQLRLAVSEANGRVQSHRFREQEVVLSLQTEEARWNDLISRMEQAIKR